MQYQDAMNYFKGAPETIIELAKKEALQYVLADVDGETKPYITVAFWGTWDALYSTLEYDGQMDLILSLSKQRSQTEFSIPIVLKKTDALCGDIDEIKVSMEELNIKLEE